MKRSDLSHSNPSRPTTIVLRRIGILAQSLSQTRLTLPRWTFFKFSVSDLQILIIGPAGRDWEALGRGSFREMRSEESVRIDERRLTRRVRRHQFSS
jgi:hypothetical protein